MDSGTNQGYRARASRARLPASAGERRRSNNNPPRMAGCHRPGRQPKVPAVFRRALLCLPALALVAARPAHAHAILEDSTPKPGGSIAAGTAELRLRYNSRIDQGRSRLTLTRPDKSKETLPIVAGTPPDIVAASVTLAPGAYVLRWQVLAVDGHITRGDLPFTVKAP